ncbi:hypothetical protein GGR57DRAFT_484648 [Xylariaceae sp. FL1272]|nr:hypothetical protein GGR57DRAFT_484648 [Xylariaceae sp. FL1272]
MADYFLDLPSSPDPLADDIPPSSAHPPSRRITKPQNDIPSLPIPQSSPSRRVRASSPRKRTFELDVGNERSPQRIRVTVEAEEHLKHGNVSRQLFSSSPTRKPRKSKPATTTTTTVPLNDEPGNMDGENTPRKRGRPRRISNGTPMPKTRKRAGTPVQRKSKQPRLDGEAPSEASMMSDAPTDMGPEGEQDVAQPKPRIRKRKTRKTPKKTTTTSTVPSSQLSTTATGGKRGRPRKALMPEEVAVLAEAAVETTALPTSESDMHHDMGSETGRDPDMPRDAISSDGIANDDLHIDSGLPQRENSITPTPSNYNITQQEHESIERVSTSPRESHQELDGNDDDLMYPAMEQRSDTESEQDDGNDITYNRQDTIANASDFSMIAVESLPSFQNSFRASQRSGAGAATSDAPEYGEETSRIINETLESLRRSMQDGTSGPPRHTERDDQDELSLYQGETETIHQSTHATSSHRKRAFSKSPRRPKGTPLSRQVFAGRATNDDSFSSLPDSVLHAATPGRLPMKQTVPEQYGEDHDEYDDSFSEVPDEILEAATPRPPKRPRSVNNSSPIRTGVQQQSSRPAVRRTSAEYGSARLPTPDETSSSNSGSKQANEEDTAGAPTSHAQSRSTNHVDIPSSPPNMTRPRSLDYGPGASELTNESTVNGLQVKQSPSTRVQPPAKSATIPFQSLEAPLPTVRPSLSPIMRAGRTLQNVMSDMSSPEVREGSLGSPFRGSAESQMYRQSSVGRSPSPQRNREVESQPPSTPTPMDRSFRSHTSRSYGRASLGYNESRRSLGPGRQNNSVAEALKTTVEITNEAPDVGKQAYAQSTISSTKAAPPSEDELSDAAQESSPMHTNNEGLEYQSASPENESLVATQGTIRRQLGTTRDGEVEESDEDHHEEVMDDQDEPEDEPNAEADDMDDLDVWDIEASRPSPVKQSQPPPEPIPIAPKADVQPSRRRKIPSPWRKTSRRLIYQDEIASSSQIEIEDDVQSEAEEAPVPEPIPQPMAPTRQQHFTSRPEARSQKDVSRVVPESPQAERSAQTSARARDDMQESVEEPTGPSNPMEFDEPEEHQGDAEYFDDLAGLADQDSSEPEDSDMPRGITDDDDMGVHEEEHPEPAEAEISQKAEKTIAPAIADESGYSLLKEKETPKPQEKPAPPKSRFFSGFDFLNFFSSPANLPGKKTAETTPAETSKKPSAPEPVLPTIERPREQPRAVFSTGLFPSIPQTQNFKPSPERRQDLFSPGRTLRSNDTIPDTYAPTSSTRGRSTSPAESAVLSTPERHVFSPIEQKRNFTPQPGERGSLFVSPTKAKSSAPRIEVEEDAEETEEEKEEQNSSGMTDGSEYERVPPRAKPSQWDRNASPVKSSFRSPLKPTTPGRVVAFTNNMSGVVSPSPLAQVQGSGMGNGNNLNVVNMRNGVNGVGSTNGLNGGNVVMQGPLLQRPDFEDHDASNRSTTNLDANRGFGASVNGNANGYTGRNPPAYLPSQSSQRPQPALNQNQSRNNPPTTNFTRPTSNGPLNPPQPNSRAQSRSQPQPQPHPQIQLQTQKWLKSHWVLLDEILKLRRSDPERFAEIYAYLPQLSQRKSKNLLGKEVVANGERMQLREWHLDVVEAFMGEMDMMRNAGMTLGGSGWSEKDVAKRVFCLLVGEEKRGIAGGV